MKRMSLIILFAFCCTAFGQSKMYIHKSDKITLGVPLSSVTWKTTSEAVVISSAGISQSIPIAQIDSISFAADSDTIRINYTGNSVEITNPLAFENVSVDVSGAKVTITSTSSVAGLNYEITGATTDGMLKMYSNNKYNLIMNNVELANASGPAINVQSGKKTTVVLPAGTVNTITDGYTYSDTSTGSGGTVEDQNAAFFCKGDVVFSGTGTLTINGVGTDKHGLYTKDAMEFASANLIVKSASKDGIHAKDGFTVTSGTINVTATGDAIDADKGAVSITGGSITTNNSVESANGISSSTTMDISNAEINVTVAGDKAKGLKADQQITLGPGNITITASGNAVLETSGSGYDPSYCTAIKSDSSITINGAGITIKLTGKGGKGISSDSDIIVNSGTVLVTSTGASATYKNSTGVTDSYHSTCLSADGNIKILGGTVTTSSSGTSGRGITSDGTLTIGDGTTTPSVNATTTGGKLLVSGSGQNAEYDEAKTISCDGAITINSGYVTISSADDGIKSDASVTVNNGEINILKAYEGIEAPYITFNNGTVNIAVTDDGINTSKGNGGESNDGSIMTINGGAISVNSSQGDGLDSNGSIVMTGGTVIVNGPPSQPEVAIDYNGTFNISGGLLIASGPNSGNMIQATSTSSAQYCIKATTSSSISSSTIFHIQDASGNNMVTFKPLRTAYYFVFSSPDIKSGATYSIYTGGTSTGTYFNGLYEGGTYSGGTLKKSFSITSKVTSVTF